MSIVEQEAEGLAELGVSFLAGVPGSGASYELLDAAERHGIPFLPTAHEAAGVMIAGAAARQGGRVGAALSIKGPGVANLLAGVALARFENYPVITMSEAYPPDAVQGLQHKRLEQDALLRAASKAVFYRDRRTTLQELAAVAVHEPSGPVHLNLVDYSRPLSNPAAVEGESGDFDAVLSRISESRRPLLICGSALTRLQESGPHASEVGELTVPVFTTAAAKGTIDERLPASAGVFTGAGQALAPEQQLLQQADLVVGIGLRNVEVLGARPFGVPYVAVDNAPAAFQDGFDPVEHCSTDLRAAVRAIVERMAAHRWGLDAVAAARAAIAAHLERDELLPAACYASLEKVPGRRLVTDSGNFTIVAEHVWRASVPAEFVGSSNGRFMGAGLPQAIGVALQDRSRPVICTVGDGGLPPFVAEWKIAIERGLPLLLILMTDGYYGSMRARVLERGYTNSGVRVTRPSWQRIMAAMGCPAVRVSDRKSFDDAVGAWVRAQGPLFIEAVMPDGPYLDMVKLLRG